MRIGYADYEKRVDRLEKWDKAEKILGFKLPVCYILTAAQGYKVINVIKLAEMLKVPDKISVQEYLILFYGTECAELVDGLI